MQRERSDQEQLPVNPWEDEAIASAQLAEEEEESAEDGAAARFSRYSRIVDPEKTAGLTVNLIGCGGIGSWAAMGLACLGVKLTIFDPETTELVNFGGQPLPFPGAYKAMQIEERMQPIATSIFACTERFGAEQAEEFPADVWASAVDSMESRREIWRLAMTEYGPRKGWYIDSRAGGTESHVLTVKLADPDVCERYIRTLAPTNGFTEAACGERFTAIAGMGAATQIIGEVMRVLRGEAKSRQQNVEWMSGSNFEGWTK